VAAIRGILRWVVRWWDVSGFVPAICTGDVYANPTPTAGPYVNITPTDNAPANPTPTGEVAIDEFG